MRPNELIEDKYYFAKGNWNHIFIANKPRQGDGFRYKYKICLYQGGSYDLNGTLSSSLTAEKPTNDQIRWLDYCIKKKKFIPFDEIPKSNLKLFKIL